jgi:hypothetical protein
VQAANFTIIPKELYRAGDLTGYSRFLAIEPGDVILVNELDASNQVFFKLKQTFANSITRHFDLKNVYFSGKALIAAINTLKDTGQNLYAHVEGRMLQLVYINNGELKFYNTFEFNNPEELMYYIVLTANELEVNLDKSSLILSGEVSFSDKKIQLVNELLAKVYFNQTQQLLLPQGFLSHQILMLSGLSLCASLVEY